MWKFMQNYICVIYFLLSLQFYNISGIKNVVFNMSKPQYNFVSSLLLLFPVTSGETQEVQETKIATVDMAG